MTLSEFHYSETIKIIDHITKNMMTEEEFLTIFLLSITSEEDSAIIEIDKTPDGKNIYITTYSLRRPGRSYLFLISVDHSNDYIKKLEKERPGYDDYYIYSYKDRGGIELASAVLFCWYKDESEAFSYPKLHRIKEEIDKRSEIIWKEDRKLFIYTNTNY